MFTPEREPHPAVEEIRYLMQPVVFKPNEAYTSAECVRVTVKEGCTTSIHLLVQNRYSFSTLEHLDWSWDVTSNRSVEPIRRGQFQLNDPFGDDEICINLQSVISRINVLEKSRPARGNSYFLNIQGHLRKATAWAKRGHTLIRQQIPIKFVFVHPIPTKIREPKPNQPVSWRLADGEVVIERPGKEGSTKIATVDPRTGGINSLYDSRGQNLLKSPILPNFCRAATDNDQGGFEKPLEFLFPGFNIQYLFGILHRLGDFSYAARWKYVGLDAAAEPFVECTDLQVRDCEQKSAIHIQASCHVRNFFHRVTLFDVKIQYYFWGDGRIRVRYHVDPWSTVKRIESLPRVGVNMTLVCVFYSNESQHLPSLLRILTNILNAFAYSFQQREDVYEISYFGKGPHENYPDRKAAGQMGQYRTTPRDMGYLKYIVPGENGSRSDCEWICFRDEESSSGLLVTTANRSFSCSALHYSIEELDRARHTYDLPERRNGKDPIHVNIDFWLMGLGGDTR